MATFSAKPQDIERKWHLFDAKDLVLGRLASQAALLLKGKHKPYYTPSMDCGDHVVIINAAHVHLTGRKQEQKKYYWHTGYPGGLKERSAKDTIEGRFPERVVRKAVERMITRNPLGRKQMTKLHVYAGEQHPHEGQKPATFAFAKQNTKNTKR